MPKFKVMMEKIGLGGLLHIKEYYSREN